MTKRAGLTDDEQRDLEARACRAYLRWCDRNGATPQAPASALTSFATKGGTTVLTLHNVRGELASYAVTAAGRLKRVS
jgi:hypothetical protein